MIASIKPGFPEGADIRAYAEGAGNCAFDVFTPKGNRFYQGRVTLCMLIRMAYEVTDIQIVGLPRWANQMNRAAWYQVEGLRRREPLSPFRRRARCCGRCSRIGSS